MTEDPNATVTKTMLNEAVDAILGGMEQMFTEQNQRFGNIEQRMGALEQRMERVENRLEHVETEVSYLKDELRGLTSELSNTPTRSELDALTRRVEHLERPN